MIFLHLFRFFLISQSESLKNELKRPYSLIYFAYLLYFISKIHKHKLDSNFSLYLFLLSFTFHTRKVKNSSQTAIYLSFISTFTFHKEKVERNIPQIESLSPVSPQPLWRHHFTPSALPFPYIDTFSFHEEQNINKQIK